MGPKLKVLKSKDALTLDFGCHDVAVRDGKKKRDGGEGEERREYRCNLFLISESGGQRTLLIINHGSVQ